MDTPPSPAPESQPAKNKLLEPSDYSRYLLESRSEVLFVLRNLNTGGDRISVYFNEGRDFLLTTLLAIEESRIILDCGSDELMNRRAEVAKKLFCATSHEKVQVQFTLLGVQRITYEGRPAFAAAIPSSVLRLQRREFYRLTTPVAHPLKCRIPIAQSNGGIQVVETNVLDISGGGVAILNPGKGALLEPGMEFTNCQIELPEVGRLVVTLQIRSMYEVTLRNGSRITRVGCQFINLPGSMMNLVQRYIIKVERERKARESGLN